MCSTGWGQDELGHTLMPVGAHSKDRIRQMAQDAGFPNAAKPDSQDICFIPFGDYKAFLKERIEATPGEIVDTDGTVLGAARGHRDVHGGAAPGVGPGNRGAAVCGSGWSRRKIAWLSGGRGTCTGGSLRVSRVNFVSGRAPEGPAPVSVKIRYKFREAPAVLEATGNGALVVFDEPQRAITPGQAAVFYEGDRVLGGGVIS